MTVNGCCELVQAILPSQKGAAWTCSARKRRTFWDEEACPDPLLIAASRIDQLLPDSFDCMVTSQPHSGAPSTDDLLHESTSSCLAALTGDRMQCGLLRFNHPSVNAGLCCILRVEVGRCLCAHQADAWTTWQDLRLKNC